MNYRYTSNYISNNFEIILHFFVYVFQSKVAQLYHLDQLLQEESGTLQSLQRDKEDLERALGGIKARIQDTRETPMALEAAKKQQHLLERELSRVHQLLAENSKVAEVPSRSLSSIFFCLSKTRNIQMLTHTYLHTYIRLIIVLFMSL